MKFHVAVLSAALAVCATGAALAHHSFAMFDNTKTTDVTGVVKDVDYTNPHSWVYLTGADAKMWTFEAGSPNQLIRKGWKKNTVKAGDKITVTMHPLKSGELGGSLMSIAFADGSGRTFDAR